MPRFTTLLGRSSIAARRAITFLSSWGSGGSVLNGIRSSPERAGLYVVP
jgi:hypothetical protein